MSLAGLLLAAALAQGAPAAAPVPADADATAGAELSVALSPENPTVGDRVTAVLTLTVPADQLEGEPEFPAWGPAWGAVEIFTAEEPRKLATRQGTVTWRQRLELAAFRPGANPLPPRKVRVPLTDGPVEVPTPEGLTLEVTSVLPVSPESPPAAPGEAPPPREIPEPRPPEPPRSLPWGTAFFVTAAALGAACLGLLLFLWRRRSAEETPGAARLSPLAELEQRLHTVTAQPSPEAGHVVLSMALRRYLGRRLGFAAPESTTTEIRRQLASRHLPEDASRDAVEILTGCDLIKFAGRRDDRGELATALRARARQALAAARRVEDHLRPPEPDREATA